MLASLRTGTGAWLRQYRIDWLIASALLLGALVLRLVKLNDIPAGLHGDEAWTGLDAIRVLHHGWIGPYVRSAGGQPTGPLYFVAPFIAVFGRTVLAIRLPLALLGAATVGLTYVTFRLMFDRPVATLAALLLCISAWHIHYSRMAFMVISWPLAELVTLALFFLAWKSGRWIFYALSGLSVGLGVYTYNAYPAFLLAFALFVIWIAVFHWRHQLGRYAKNIGLLVALAVLAALPLIVYAANPSNDYFGRPEGVLITQEDNWQNGSFTDRAHIALSSARGFYADTFWRGSPDFTDGMGERPVLDHVSLVLLGLGLVISIRRWREAPYVALLLMFAILPIASIATEQAGMFRRTLGLTPFLAALEALPLALLWRRAHAEAPVVRGVSLGAIAIVVASIAFTNLHFYFADFPGSGVAAYTYSDEMVHVSQYVKPQQDNTYVYFYSSRWSFDYEVRRYLASKSAGEDRSREFSTTGTVRLDADRTKGALFIFLDPYLELANEVQRLYPGGVRRAELYGDRRVMFTTYTLPALGGAATPPPGATPIPTPTREVLPGGAERDRTRQAGMTRIQQALVAYQQKYQEFPTNGGTIQKFCVSESADAGCKLGEFLDPLPQDPSGDSDEGFFYSSNGLTYTIYAYRESDTVPQCDEHPEELARLVDVMCVTGP